MGDVLTLGKRVARYVASESNRKRKRSSRHTLIWELYNWYGHKFEQYTTSFHVPHGKTFVYIAEMVEKQYMLFYGESAN
jgi:hypothetical protein